MRAAITSFLIFLTALSFAQSPGIFNYQGVARDANGEPLVNRTMNMGFDVLQGNATGTAVYQEDHLGVVTDAKGLFTVPIGAGLPVPGSGTLSQVDWSNGPFFLKVYFSVQSQARLFPNLFLSSP